MGKIITLVVSLLLLLMIAVPIGALKFEQIRVITYDDLVQIKVTVSSDKAVDDVTVTAYVLDQGIKDSSRFDVTGESSATLLLPEVVPGYATIRISASADGERRTVYRFVEIE